MTHLLLLSLLTLQQPAAKRTVEFTGTVLMNGFYNSARTNAPTTVTTLSSLTLMRSA